MTNSDEKSPETAPGREVPAWVDEVLRAETAPLPAREPVNDLRIPEPAPTQPGPHAAGDDWVARVTGNTARPPGQKTSRVWRRTCPPISPRSG